MSDTAPAPVSRGHLRRARCAPGRTRRAVVFLWFVLIPLPVLFLFSALAVDFTRVIAAQHEMTNVAAAGADAAAWQFADGLASLHPQRATTAASDVTCTALYYTRGVAGTGGSPSPATGFNCNTGGRFTARDVHVVFDDVRRGMTGDYASDGPLKVTVRVYYKVDSLIFGRLFGVGDSGQLVATASASVCLPGVTDSFTGGACSRPVG